MEGNGKKREASSEDYEPAAQRPRRSTRRSTSNISKKAGTSSGKGSSLVMGLGYYVSADIMTAIEGASFKRGLKEKLCSKVNALTFSLSDAIDIAVEGTVSAITSKVSNITKSWMLFSMNKFAHFFQSSLI